MKKKPVRRTTKLKPTDKWIVGMVNKEGKLTMFGYPTVHDTYASALRDAEASYKTYGGTFVVFAKKCVIGPSRPPVLVTEYSA